MNTKECPVCGQFVQPGKGNRCSECNSFLHPDPLKRLEADMADKLLRLFIEELKKKDRVLPSDLTLVPGKPETLSLDELAKTLFRVIEPYTIDYIDDVPTFSVLKITVLGDEKSGKLEFLQDTLSGRFDKSFKFTVGTDRGVKSLALQSKTGEKITVRLIIYDVAPQERFKDVRKIYFSGSQGALLIFNPAKYETFKHMDALYKEYNQICNGVPCVLVGLLGEKDNQLEKSQDSRSRAKSFARKHKMPYLEASLLDKQEMELPYLKLLDMLLEQYGWS